MNGWQRNAIPHGLTHHLFRKYLKILKQHLALNKRERQRGIPDLRWIDGAKLPK